MLTLSALGRGLISWVGSLMTALIVGVLLSRGLRAAGCKLVGGAAIS